MIFDLLLAVLLAQVPDQLARMEGTVVSATTGVPLKKAELTIESSGPSRRYASTSTADGKFVFENIEPGRYHMSAERIGYLDKDGGDLQLAPGSQTKDFVLKLIPGGVIAGRILDEDGEPIPNSAVAIVRVAGKLKIDADSTEVDADGRFIFAKLRPGRYYVNGWQRSPDGSEPSKLRTEIYAQTYYPGVPDMTGAVPLDLDAGMELRNLEIRLRMSRVYRVSGKVAGSNEGASLTLTREGDSLSYAQIGTDGSFQFANVLPGAYSIRVGRDAKWDTATGDFVHKRQTLFCNYPIDVGDKDVENLVIRLAPAAGISGKFTLVGALEGKHEKLPSVALTTGQLSPPPQIGEDGAFQFHLLPWNEYRIDVQDLPDGAYVKAIRFNAQELTRPNLDLTSGGSGTLEILVAPNAAEITGVVRKENGETATRAVAYLWNDSAAKTTTPGKEGGIVFRNLAPGEYHLLAWEIAADSGWDSNPSDPDFRKLFTNSITAVTVQEGSRERVELKLITREAIEAVH
jgi:Carboxypeptidase regulatory-like domain